MSGHGDQYHVLASSSNANKGITPLCGQLIENKADISAESVEREREREREREP